MASVVSGAKSAHDMPMKASRNDPCPCGSGKKFKKCCQESVATTPPQPSVEQLLDEAIAQHQAGQVAAAEAGYRAVLARQPNQIDALHLLGVVCSQHGDHDTAVTLIQEAIRLGGAHRDFLYNLANALRGVRRDAEAVEAYRQILQTQPNDIAALNNLGLAYRGAGQSAEALACFERAHQLAPTDPDLLGNIGLVLSDMNRGDESIVFYRQALAINPRQPEVLNNLGSSLQNAGDTAGAIAAYQQALACRPAYAEAHSNLIFSLDFVEAGGVEAQQAERKRWAATFAARVPAYREYDNDRTPERKLRIGYVSPDFRHHSAAYAFAPLILDYDRTQFEVVCYSNSPVSDDLTQRFQAHATAWRPIFGLNDAQAAAQVRADGVDILVDLAGHSRNNRLGVMAYHPAPLQASGWGHANGTGLPAVDFLFSDPVYIPPAEAAFYQEEILYLPCVISYLVQDAAPALSASPVAQNGYLTFGSFSRLAKISTDVLDLWADLLCRIPDSRMLFKAPELNSPGRCSELLAYMQARGVTPERLTLQPGTPWREHVAAIASVDIALDPYPHGGGVSVLDCLWMGVPVLAMQRPIPAGRVAASILKVHGLDDWIASDAQDFLALAARKAAAPAALATLRAELRARVAASPVGNGQHYAAAVETHYRAIWRRFTQTVSGR